MDIIFASNNEGKIKEVKRILGDHNITSLKDNNIDIDVVEDRDTYEGNALKKAREIAAITNKIVMADDSGLEIEAFDNKPGVYTARFLNEYEDYADRRAEILRRLEGVENRKARFVCTIALVMPSGAEIIKTAYLDGEISKEDRGTNGFAYDSIFYVEEHKMTNAEMEPEFKNKISHRAKALEMIREAIELIK